MHEPLNRGVLITFEGGEGAGKSTHIRFLAEVLEATGRTVLRVREPGGTPAGEALRQIVLDPAHEGLSVRAELLIYEAARAQLVDGVIAPALERGEVVLCDRFCDSTLAYQGFGRGLDLAFVERANAFAAAGIVPDATLLLQSASVAEGLERATRQAAADRIEAAGEAFHARVRAGFERLAAEEPERIRRIDSSGLRSQTARAVIAAVSPLFGWDRAGFPFPDALFDDLDRRIYPLESAATGRLAGAHV